MRAHPEPIDPINQDEITATSFFDKSYHKIRVFDPFVF